MSRPGRSMQVGMTEGLASVQLRIAELQQRFAPPPVSAPAVTTPTATSFDTLLQQATAQADLGSYGNGRIPEHLLTSIGGGEKLAAPAAEAFSKMRADAERAGVTFGVNDSYRSFDEQVDMANRKGLYGQGGLAAKPGTSEHGLGISVDLELDSKAQQWMNANGGRYGFVNNVRGEPWHWTFKSA